MDVIVQMKRSGLAFVGVAAVALGTTMVPLLTDDTPHAPAIHASAPAASRAVRETPMSTGPSVLPTMGTVEPLRRDIGLVSIRYLPGWVDGNSGPGAHVINDMSTCTTATYACPFVEFIDLNSAYGKQHYRGDPIPVESRNCTGTGCKPLVRQADLYIDGQTVQNWVTLYPDGHSEEVWYAEGKSVLIVANDYGTANGVLLNPGTRAAISSLKWE